MATIKAGTYRFNDVLTAPSAEMEQYVDFTATPPVDDPPIVFVCNGMRIDGADLIFYVVDPMEVEYQVYDGEWGSLTQGVPIQTITIPNDAEVSAEFASWFAANTAEQKQISGAWKFKDELSLSVDLPTLEQNVNFTCGGKITITEEFMGFPPGTYDVTYNCHTIWVTHSYNTEDPEIRADRLVSKGEYSSVLVNDQLIELEASLYLFDTTFDNTGDKETIDFGIEPQTVSAEFYNWLTVNAKPLTTVKYNGAVIASIEGGKTKALRCKNTFMRDDIVLYVPETPETKLQDKTITENNTTITPDEGFDGFGSVTIEVPLPTTYWGEYTNL